MKRIAIIGSHGIPARYGGFETFAEHLAISLAKNGFEVTVVNERDHKVEFNYPGITILHSEYKKSKSPIAYYRNSIMLVRNAELIIVCGSGGSLYYNHISASTIITNVDGLEHHRKRYSFLQRTIVYFLERLAIKKSDFVIADSDHVFEYWKKKFPEHQDKMRMIPYGADECTPPENGVLEKYNIKENEYFLAIARLVPENNIEAILNAFRHYKSNKKLVIVGNVDSAFAEKMKRHADNRVIFTEGIYEKTKLDTLRAGCYLYIHGHSVGGTNPSLLEAMAAGCACLCHDNVFNRETTSDRQEYFKESFDLAIHLNSLEHNPSRIIHLKEAACKRIQDYSWSALTESYLKLIYAGQEQIQPVEK